MDNAVVTGELVENYWGKSELEMKRNHFVVVNEKRNIAIGCFIFNPFDDDYEINGGVHVAMWEWDMILTKATKRLYQAVLDYVEGKRKSPPQCDYKYDANHVFHKAEAQIVDIVGD